MSTLQAKRLIDDNLNIPTIPAILARVQALVDDPEAGLRDIGEVVAEDPPLAAKVLRIANSAFYGLQEPCISAEHATAVLGPRVLRNLVLQASVISQFDHLRNEEGFDLDELWLHSAMVAQTAEFVARRARTRMGLSPEELYVCGLLHDLGQVVMLEGLGGAFVVAWRKARTSELALPQIENETFGFDHADVGAMIASRWGLPAPVVEAIQYHHTPAKGDPVVAAVALANEIVKLAGTGADEDVAASLDADTTGRLGLDVEAVEDVIFFVSGLRGAVEV